MISLRLQRQVTMSSKRWNSISGPSIRRRKSRAPRDISCSFDATRLDPSLISSMDSCLETASLSPYLPVPHAVARRMLELARAGPNDVHYELGSGDGRVNFEAVQHFDVSKSVGVEIDPTLIKLSKQMLLKQSGTFSVMFVLADLMNPRHEIWSRMEQEATIITMYFVENALYTLQPSLTKIVNQNPSCRIVTCGYPMPLWEPVEMDHKNSLPIHLYESFKGG